MQLSTEQKEKILQVSRSMKVQSCADENKHIKKRLTERLVDVASRGRVMDWDGFTARITRRAANIGISLDFSL